MTKRAGRPTTVLQIIKKNKAAVAAGTQMTLPTGPRGSKQEEFRLPTVEEAEAMYHAVLAEIWKVLVENIRTKGWALPVITYYNQK